jgi:hypothetical protein
MIRLALLLSLACLAACKTPVGVHNLSVAPNSGPRCADLCGQIGMPLDSVVIMADNVGCVCRAAIPGPPPPTDAPGETTPQAAAPVAGAATAGGMTAILIQQQRQQQQRRSHQHHHRRHK